MKTSQVRKTPPCETITPAQIRPPEPVVPYTRKSRRLSGSTPSKQLPFSSEMHSVPKSSKTKSKGIEVAEQEALMVEEIQEDDNAGDGGSDDDSDDDYDESDLEAPNSSSDEKDGEDEEREEEKDDVEEVGVEAEGAPEETIAAIDQLIEEVNCTSGNPFFEILVLFNCCLRT